MEYDLFYDELSDRISVKFSMGHEVMGYWLSEEIGHDGDKLSEIISAVQAYELTEWQYTGRDFSLSVEDGEVCVYANSLHVSDDALEEDMHYYDDESITYCGVDDFIQLLQQYFAFLQESVTKKRW